MAEDSKKATHEESSSVYIETKDRGLLGFLGKEDEKKSEEVLVSEMKNVHVADKLDEDVKVEDKDDEKKHKILEKLHRSGSNSSSSSSDEEEVDENGEKKKKKKKKGLKEKIKEKLSSEKEQKEDDEKSTEVVVEHLKGEIPETKSEEAQVTEVAEEKKGLLEKIKEKLPGGQPKKTEEVLAEETKTHEGEPVKEKKGFLEKIKEKLPGYHKHGEETSDH